MKKICVLAAVLFTVAVLAAASAEAQEGRRGGRIPETAELVEQLGLTEFQAVKLREKAVEFQMAEIDRRASLEKAQITLREQMNAESPDPAVCNPLIKQISELTAAGVKARLENSLAVRRDLTPQQWKAYRRLRFPGRGEGGPEAGRPRREGRGPRAGRPGAPAKPAAEAVSTAPES